MKTIPEILQQAFEQIKREHGVAIEHVTFYAVKQVNGDAQFADVTFDGSRANKEVL